MPGQMCSTVAHVRSPAAQGPLPCPRGLQRVRLVVRASRDTLSDGEKSLFLSARQVLRARQTGKNSTGVPPQLVEPSRLQSAIDSQRNTSSLQRAALPSREPRPVASSPQPAAASPAQSDASASDAAAAHLNPPAQASAPASAPASVSAVESASADALQQEDALLRQVDDYGSAWAERQQEQFVAAQAQLQANPAQVCRKCTGEAFDAMDHCTRTGLDSGCTCRKPGVGRHLGMGVLVRDGSKWIVLCIYVGGFLRQISPFG